MKKILLLLLVLIVACTSQTPDQPESQNINEASAPQDTSLTDILDAGVITVGSDIPYPPMEYYDESGDIVGFDIDVIRSVAAKLGVKADVQVVPWDDIFDTAEKGGVDVIISSITITPKRQEKLLFSIPYINGGQVVVARTDSPIVGSESLAEMKVGVQVETTGYDEAIKLTSEVTTYDTMDAEGQATTDLLAGTIDAIIVDYLVAVEMVAANEGLRLAGEPFTNEYYGIATQNGNDALMDAINSALVELKDSGEIENLKTKWFG